MKKGDKVLCIKDKWRGEDGEVPSIHPIKGEIYTVVHVTNDGYLTLSELPVLGSWNQHAFTLIPNDGIPHEVSGKVVEHAPVN
jgi:hypothetical protein